jgi:cytochrome c biogenesis protein CcdA
MVEQITHTLKELASQPLGLVLAFILGSVSAVTSACCTLPALSLLVGYSGTRNEKGVSNAFRSTCFFTLGIVLSLMIVGGVAGFAGHVAQVSLGRYWKVFAGLVAIVFGLAALNLLPFELSLGKFEALKNKLGKSGVVIAGLVLGGVVAVSSLCCNPGIFIVIGAAVLQGKVFWATSILAMFAIGFSIPLGAVLFGISISRVSLAAKGFDRAIRWTTGAVLIGAGFYFLFTF